MNNSSRVIVNTLAQHIRAIFSMCLSLYATRLILRALGDSDYGIFMLVGGVVAMLGFVTNAMVVTTQRYLSYRHGQGQMLGVKLFFENSLLLHIAIGGILALVLLLLTPILFHQNDFLNIDPSRMETAKVVYYLTILSLFLTFVTAPYRSLFIARENIVYISIIDITDGILRLLAAILLLHFGSDKLITYALCLAGIMAFNYLAFCIYARRFEESVVIPSLRSFDLKIVREIFAFAGWTIYSMGCILARTQGLSVILNRFFGTIINTSYGLAMQVSGAISVVAQAVVNAMSPQVVKAEAATQHLKSLALAESTCKYAYLLLAIVGIPIAFEMPEILRLWLDEVPPHTVMICRFVLLAAVVDQTTIGLNVANQAMGRIRNFSLIVNTIKVLTLPIAYLCLKLGLGVVSVMWCYILVEALCAMVRLPYLKVTAGLSVRHFFRSVVLRQAVPTASFVMVGWMVTSWVDVPFRFVLTLLLTIAVGIVFVWLTGLSTDERSFVTELVRKNKLIGIKRS